MTNSYTLAWKERSTQSLQTIYIPVGKIIKCYDIK